MVTITYKNMGIIIDGHAEEPVVCHGISALTQTVANYVADNGWGSVLLSEGHLEITVKEQHFGNDLFRAMRSGIRDIAESYPGNVRIEHRQCGELE